MLNEKSQLICFDNGPLRNPILSAPKRLISGDVNFRSVSIFQGDQGRVRSGVWESNSGSFQADTTGYIEFGTIIEGQCRIVDPDGLAHDLEAGDAFIMPEGYSGRWEVSVFVKKIYFIVTTASAVDGGNTA